MTEQNKTKRDLEQENAALQETNDTLLEQTADLAARIEAMEARVSEQQASGEYTGPAPVVLRDPFDEETNPHHFMKHPEGKVLGWKNATWRNEQRGWRGWTPVTYDSEIGQSLSEYIASPPAKMEGSAQQDNYVRRGTDTVLCWIDEEIWKARQQKREHKALRKQMAANASRNTSYGPGVETFGDGVQEEQRPAGGFKMGRTPAPLGGDISHRTEMFRDEE
jgi:hypothetical protein